MRSAEIQCCTFTQTFPLCNMVKTYSKCLPSSIPRICSVAIKWFNCSAEHREIQNLRRVIFLPSLYLTLPPSSPSLMHLSPHHSNPLLSFPAFVLILNKHSWHPVFSPPHHLYFLPPSVSLPLPGTQTSSAASHSNENKKQRRPKQGPSVLIASIQTPSYLLSAFPPQYTGEVPHSFPKLLHNLYPQYKSEV